MNIVLHIERVVLEGIPLASHEAAAVQAAVQSELARLLRTHGLAPGMAAGGALAAAAGSTLAITPGVPADRVGADIAGAIFGAIGIAGSALGAAAPTRGDQRRGRI